MTVTATPAAAQLRRDRYVTDVMAAHDRLSLRGLADRIAPDSLLYRARRPDGLTVLVARQEGIPLRYLLGIYGFRLAQYLRLQFASGEIAYRRALFSEPPGDRTEIHALALDEGTGAILRYVSLVGTADETPLPGTDPRRSLFPCELAHHVNLFDHVPVGPVTTDRIWEIKRLVRRPGPDTLADRMRITLELMLGFYTALDRLDPPVEVLVGDGEEGVALSRLTRSLRDVTVLEGTRPSLPRDDLMFPLYTQREVVKAFVARAPHGAERRELLDALRDALDDPDLLRGFRTLVRRAGGEIRRVRL